MGIVRFALKYPHTFYVVAALILFLGVTAAFEMEKDIFPEVNIPVVSVIWQYTGLDTTEMEQRFTTYSQYAISTNVSPHQGHRSRDGERHFGAENLFPAGCQPQSGNLSDRRCHERDPRVAANRNPAADCRTIQCVCRAGSANRSQLRQSHSSAALRLRHLSVSAVGSRRSTASHCRRLPAENMGSSWSISTRQSCCPKA